jgi:putative two-component system response regulator
VRQTGRILVVDDVSANVELLRRTLSAEGYSILIAGDGTTALEIARQQCPDLVLLDIVMPGLDGFEVCRRLKQAPATRLVPVVLVTALNQRDMRVQGALVGADDFLTKPIDTAELKARVRSLLRLKRHTDDLDSAAAIILGFAQIIEARDAYTRGHCQRLSSYASILGQSIGLPQHDLHALERGGYLHDIGKVVIPDGILLKPGPLTPDEYDVIKQHPLVGDSLCGNLRSLKAVRQIIRHHHERLDGSGYPDGLRDATVPLLAQIIGIVDVFDAITTDRPYRRALPRERAFEILRQEVAKGWRQRQLVDPFIRLIQIGRFDDLSPSTRDFQAPRLTAAGQS